jgi:hypothetical protein
MPHKKRLIYRHVLNGNDALFASELKHAIDEEERVAMGQDAKNFANVKPGLAGFRGL